MKNPSRSIQADWFGGEVSVIGTFGYRREFPQALDLLRSGKIDIASHITDFYPLDEITLGFERQLSKSDVLKVMIQPNLSGD